MIIGHGIDLIEIERIRRAVHRFGPHFLHKVFVPAELAYCLSKKDPAPALAARFAAKEALAKAMGTGIGQRIGWHDIEITHDQNHKPTICLGDRVARDMPKIWLSLSHTHDYALASVIIEG